MTIQDFSIILLRTVLTSTIMTTTAFNHGYGLGNNPPIAFKNPFDKGFRVY